MDAAQVVRSKVPLYMGTTCLHSLPGRAYYTMECNCQVLTILQVVLLATICQVGVYGSPHLRVYLVQCMEGAGLCSR
jgi:hypothetical protein